MKGSKVNIRLRKRPFYSIEITTRLNPSSDEFIIGSPTLLSTKYWPGALGRSCSHAIVLARLIIEGEDYGVHSLIMQLRSLDDYSPLLGIELGDIGITVARYLFKQFGHRPLNEISTTTLQITDKRIIYTRVLGSIPLILSTILILDAQSKRHNYLGRIFAYFIIVPTVCFKVLMFAMEVRWKTRELQCPNRGIDI